MSGIHTVRVPDLRRECLTFVDILRARAELDPDRIAYTSIADGDESERDLSYGQLDTLARRVASLLQCHSQPGDRVILLYPPGLDYVAALFGCMYAGRIPVPAFPPDPTRLARTAPRLAAILKDAEASVILSLGMVVEVKELLYPFSEAFERATWLATDALPEGLEIDWSPVASRSDDIALLQYTSGSTGDPKGILVSHHNLLANQAVLAKYLPQVRDTRIVSWLPHFHDLGLIGGITAAPFVGCRLWMTSPVAFLQRPLRWLQTISRVRGTFSGAPNFAYDLCVRRITAAEREQLDLTSLETLVTAAETVRAGTIARFLGTFAPCGLTPSVFTQCYGLAEITLCVTGGHNAGPVRYRNFERASLDLGEAVEKPDSPLTDSSMLGYHAIAEVRVVVVDPVTRRRCADGRVGELWVSGAAVAQGYWRRPELTEEVFRAYTADTGEGPFLRTGDLGFAIGDVFYLAGRLKDVVIVRGRNLYPQDIELTVERSHPLLRPGCSAAFSVDTAGQERLVVVAEVARNDAPAEEIASRVRRAVAEWHEVSTHAVVLIERGSLPKTSSGKVQRRACRQAYLSGGLAVVGQSVSAAGAPDEAEPPGAGRDAVVTWLVSEAALELGIDPRSIDPREPLASLGLDSLAVINLQNRIEARFGRRVTVSMLLESTSLGELAAALRERADGAEARPVPPASVGRGRSPGSEFPLSHGQRALWFLQRLAPESRAYHIARAVRVRGPLDVAALQRALQRLVARHASLRTTFPEVAGQPLQRVQPRASVAFRQDDASRWTEEALRLRLEREARRPFDLEDGPLARVAVLSRSAEEHAVLLQIHHIVVDFASLLLLAGELRALYAAECVGGGVELPAVSVGVREFVNWQAELLASPAGEELARSWEQKLLGAPFALDLPTDRPRPAVQTFRGATHRFAIDAGLADELRRLAQREGATLAMVLLAAFQGLLHRQSGQEEFLIGCPARGRSLPEWSSVVGYFVNPLVLRVSLADDPPFAALVARARETVSEAIERQDYPFPVLVQRLRAARDPSRSPVFQVMFDFFAAQGELRGLLPLAVRGEGVLRTGELELEPMSFESGAAQFDLTLTMADSGAGIDAAFEYSTDLFDARTVAALAGQLEVFLRSVAANPWRGVASVPLLEDAERSRIAALGRGPARKLPEDPRLHVAFEEQARRNPAAEAARCDRACLTYGELDRRANRLARRLIASGVGRASRVALLLERSTDMLVSLIAILKAGAAYVPLDPRHPASRQSFMVEDSGARVLLTETPLVDRLPPHGATVLCVDAIANEDDGSPCAAPHVDFDADDLCYVLYTSGTTGHPKGVEVSHRAVVNFIAAALEEIGLGARDLVLSATALSFDIATFEIFAPLWVGARLRLVSLETAGDGRALRTAVETSGATAMQATPSTWRMLLDVGWRPSRSMAIYSGGEALPRDLADRLLTGGGPVWNFYGPTEAAIYCAIDRVAPGTGPVAIGRAIANTELHVLDEARSPVPIGVPGELYIGGVCLARGYANLPELTAERFVVDPLDPTRSRRLYRTGDLARYRRDGSIEFLGRLDQQVKVRGHRIEPEEIEAVLRRVPAIRDAVVVVRDDGRGWQRLVAYTAQDEGSVPAERLREAVRAELPAYMMPHAFVALRELPHTTNGKIDRKALPAPDPTGPPDGAQRTAPRTPLEESLAALWASVLGLPRVGVHDEFFLLGGDSLRAVELCSAIATTLGFEVPVKLLVQHPTVAALAAALDWLPAPQEADEEEPSSPTRPASRPFLTLESRSLLGLIATGAIRPLDAAAIAPLPSRLIGEGGATASQIRREWCEEMPLLAGVLDTAMGRIGLVLIPRFETELYNDPAGVLDDLTAALTYAKHAGASCVSLTGLLPSATDYGQSLVARAGEGTPVAITTGHATTVAGVVLTIRAALERVGRDLRRERVAFLGLGSIGAATLRLVLGDAHPEEILLCDLFAQQARLDQIGREVVNAIGFRGALRVIPSAGAVPEEIYDATLIVGATSVPDVLDVARLRPGTIVVDDSYPPCFSAEAAAKRFAALQDVLAVGAGVVRAPYPITELRHLPRGARLDGDGMACFFPWRDPREIGSCVLSSALSTRNADAPATLGLPAAEACRAHLATLARLGFGAADLHCGGLVYGDAALDLFRERFGGFTPAASEVGRDDERAD